MPEGKVDSYSLDYVLKTHVQSEFDTVEKFLNQNGLSIAYYFYANGLTKDFLEYDGGTGKTNAKRILDRYAKEDYEKYSNVLNEIRKSDIDISEDLVDNEISPKPLFFDNKKEQFSDVIPKLAFLGNSPLGDLPLYVGTKLLIPKNTVYIRSLVYTPNSDTIEEGDFVDFLDQKDTIKITNGDEVETSRLPIFDLYNTGLFQKIKVNKTGDFLEGSVTDEFPNVTVYMWCRGLSSFDSLIDKNKGLDVSELPLESSLEGDVFRSLPETDDLQGQFLDISDFIQSISIQTDISSGGAFTMSLSPMICIFDENIDTGVGRWIVKESSLVRFDESGNKRSTYLSEGNVSYQDDTGAWKNSNYFFFVTINSNDLVFIKFETLEIEKFTRREEQENRKGGKGGSSTKTPYDFVVSKDAIGGKWNEIDIATPIEKRHDKEVKQIYPEAIYDMIGMVDSVSIDEEYESANTEITITGRDFTKALIEDGCYFHPLEYSGDAFGGVDIAREDNGVLANRIFGKIEHLFVYKNRSVLNSIMFIRNYIASVGYVPDSVFSNFDNKAKKWKITDSTGDFSEEDANGIWQIWKFVFDDSIANRRITDSSISTQSGSIINFINKVAQSPFIETFSDTYLDRFYTVFRKPPFDKEGYSKLAKLAKEHLVLKAENIESTNLSMSDSEVYSWYKIIPQGVFFGDGSAETLAFLPAVKFDEYAKIWGSNPLSIISNLIDYDAESTDNDKGQTYIEKQVYRDLKFMVDTTSYIPFTRSGSIELVNGDRRIKKGTCIYLETTNEVFYVTGVINNYETNNQKIDRKTVLQVERGMVYDFIEGTSSSSITKSSLKVETPDTEKILEDPSEGVVWHDLTYKEGVELGKKVSRFLESKVHTLPEATVNAPIVSYFNIIETELDFGKYAKDGYVDKKVIQNWKTNKEVFNFFLQGRQFSERYRNNKR